MAQIGLCYAEDGCVCCCGWVCLILWWRRWMCVMQGDDLCDGGAGCV